MNKLNSVVIVGRMNVGKSTLFNRLSVNVKSLILDYAGVTRDVIKDVVSWDGHSFDLTDTGGISFKKTEDAILEEVRLRAIEKIKQADLVIFVVDSKVGLVGQDLEISKQLHKMGRKVLLVLNKVDNPLSFAGEFEFKKLGHKHMYQLSAQHGTGISDLLDGIVAHLTVKTEQEEEDVRYKVVFLGKPNVGKSSLMNLLLKEERSIVTDVPGTTREAISERIKFYQEDLMVTDTPGIRRKRSVDSKLETMMVKSSFQALSDADIVLLLLDGSSSAIADQELKLAFYTFTQQHKAMIMVYNKQDLIEEQGKADMDFSLEVYDYFFKKIPKISISCKSGKNVGKVMALVKKVWERHSQELPDDELHMLFKEALRKKPLMHKSQPLEIHRARQIKNAPITILLEVNVPQWFGDSQLGYFDNVLRDTYDLQGVPIKFVLRKRA